jgi:hypothetical protein
MNALAISYTALLLSHGRAGPHVEEPRVRVMQTSPIFLHGRRRRVYTCEGEKESAMSPLSLKDDAAHPDRRANRGWMQCCGGMLRENPSAYVKGNPKQHVTSCSVKQAHSLPCGWTP